MTLRESRPIPLTNRLSSLAFAHPPRLWSGEAQRWFHTRSRIMSLRAAMRIATCSVLRAGNGAVTVTNNAPVTSTAGSAIIAAGVNGLVTVNGQGAISATGGAGIFAGSGGTGSINVTTTA